MLHSFEGLSQNFIPADGPEDSQILFVGESPGKEEDESLPPRPFVGKTGREYDGFYLPQAALRRAEVRTTNLIPYHPYFNRNPTTEEVKFFEHYLVEEIERNKPKLIVAMGAPAMKWFLGGHLDIHTVHGLIHRSKKFPDIPILPTHHPAGGLHNSDSIPLIIDDFKQIQPALEGRLPERPHDLYPGDAAAYIELTTRDEVFDALSGVSDILMGQDTEGYDGHPWGLSFSTDAGIAYVIRIASKVALAAFNEWLDTHRDVIVILHNALHDLPILREMGIHVHKFEDTMVYAYCLCLEPQGLKDLAYRYAGMRMKSYEEITGPAMRKLAAEYLLKVAGGNWGLDPKVPERESDQVIKYRQPQALHKRALGAVNDIYGLYTGVVVGERRGGSARLKELGVRVGKVAKDFLLETPLPKDWNAWTCEVPIPVRDKLEKTYGDYIFELKPPVTPDDPPDALKRWQQMQEDLDESIARAEKVIGTLPIVGLDAVEDQNIAVAYSGKDADATKRIRGPLRAKIEAAGLARLADLDMSVLPYLDRMRTVGIKVNRPHLLDYGEQLGVEMRQLQEKLHSNLGIWLNPSSPPQVAMVIYEMLGFPVVYKTDKGAPSTSDKVLEALSPLNPNIADITDYRELHKLKNTYATKLPLWMDAVGRLHTTWKYTRVASGRVSTSEPNLLGIPVRSERGNMIRAGFIPHDGCVFVGVDLSQIEVRVAAHFSKDANLMKIFLTKGADFHTLTASQMWHLTVEQIKADDEKNGGASMRSSAKNVSFGVLYGISAKGLQAQLKSKCHADWSEEECSRMIDLWLETAHPQVKWYMERQKHFCRQNGYVESLYGRRRYLPGVHSTVPRIREEAYRAAINHPIQATAAEILKIAEYNIWTKVFPKYWNFGIYVEPVLAIHDELVVECDADFAKEIQDDIIFEMEHAMDLLVPVVAKGHISKSAQDGGSWADLK